MTNDQIFYSVVVLAIIVWGYIRTVITSQRIAFDSTSDAKWSLVPVLGVLWTLGAFDTAAHLIKADADLGDWWWTIGAIVVGLFVIGWGWVKTKRNTIRANYNMSWLELHYLIVFKILCSTVAGTLALMAVVKFADEDTPSSEKVVPLLLIVGLLLVFFLPLFNGDAVREEGNAPREEN